MKKPGSFFLIAALVLSLALTAAAAETGSCTVSADSVSAAAGSTVTVPVRITGNPGFTNFAIALDYDREQLELVSIHVSDGESPYLCGSLAAVNTGWTGEDGQTYGYIVCAAAEKVTDDGILFTATFQVSETFSGNSSLSPIVMYMRNNSVFFSIFEEIEVSATEGYVRLRLLGDANDNGAVDAADAAITYAIANGKFEGSQAQKSALDVNGDGIIDAADATLIYAYANGKLTVFPADNR